jgi:glyoxylase-like metal-dependent hydrolase (beta-lactamase superfamily II)
VIERIIAPNPGPMTLTGTNTYLVSNGAGEVAVIDPGPDDARHLAAILNAAEQVGRITTILVTHRHSDHLPAAAPLGAQTGATLAGHADLPGVERVLRDGESAFDGLLALETPGHTAESLCFWNRRDGALFTGDLVVGTGTVVLDEAPGALGQYLASLERLADLAPKRIYPGHGPIVEDAPGKLTEYLEHRRQRLQQVKEVLAARGPTSTDDLVRAIYTDVPANLLAMAARNVRANLDKLTADDEVGPGPDGTWRLIT